MRQQQYQVWAIGDLLIRQEGSDVLNPEAGIGAVKPDGRMVVFQCPLIERLGVLRYRGRGRTLDMRKDRIEDERGLVREVLDVLREVTVEDREESQMVVLERHPVGEVQRPERSDPSLPSSAMASRPIS